MSRLDELIAELCPDGVKYKTIGEIATDIYRGSGIRRDQVTEEGTPCVRYGEIYTTYGVWFDKCVSHTNADEITNVKYFEHGDILFAITGESVEDIAKSCAYVGYERCLAGGDIVVLKHKEDPKYLAYALTTTAARTQKSKGKVKSKVVHSSVPAIRELIVPVPPLEVQREIVHILDKFDQDGLISALQRELELRKVQYEYYRDYLVQCEQDAPTVCVTDICDDIFLGLTSKVDYVREGGVPLVRANNMTSGQLSFDDVKYISHEQHQKLTKNHKAQKGDILVSKSGTLGVVCIVDTDAEFSIYESLICLHPNERIYSRFLLHLLRSKEVQDTMLEKKVGNAVKHLNLLTFRKLYVKIPSLETQHRIADILDRLDLISNNISEGIPAEIEARRQQYKFYRDKLLTFKEKV